MKAKTDWVRTLQYDGTQILVTREFSYQNGHVINVGVTVEENGKPIQFYQSYNLGDKDKPVTNKNWESFCERENLINIYLDFLSDYMQKQTKH